MWRRSGELFDGVRAEIHPYDVTVERDGNAEAYDCKWGARGINADVLHQLDDARTHAVAEGVVGGAYEFGFGGDVVLFI